MTTCSTIGLSVDKVQQAEAKVGQEAPRYHQGDAALGAPGDEEGGQEPAQRLQQCGSGGPARGRARAAGRAERQSLLSSPGAKARPRSFPGGRNDLEPKWLRIDNQNINIMVTLSKEDHEKSWSQEV